MDPETETRLSSLYGRAHVLTSTASGSHYVALASLEHALDHADLRDPPASASQSAGIQDMWYMCGSYFI